jgi:arsenate reductase
MAEAFLQHTDQSLEVFSAGMNPDDQTDPLAIEVMSEIGIDISNKKPKSYKLFEEMFVDYLIILGDGTKNKISPINILAKHKIHLGFDDPRKAVYLETENLKIYRQIRDEIRNELDYFYTRILSRELINE